MAPRPNCLVTHHVRCPSAAGCVTTGTGPTDSLPPSTRNSSNSEPTIRVDRSIAASPIPRLAGEEGDGRGLNHWARSPGWGPRPPTIYTHRRGRGTAALTGTLPTPTIAQTERLQSLLQLVARNSGRRRRCPIEQKVVSPQHVRSPGSPDIGSEVASSNRTLSVRTIPSLMSFRRELKSTLFNISFSGSDM